VQQAGRGLGLRLEAAAKLGFGGQVAAQELDCHRAAQPAVEPVPDLAHPPSPEYSGQLVAIGDDMGLGGGCHVCMVPIGSGTHPHKCEDELMPTLVLLRHGQSDWNAKNLFTGWYDSDLSPLGEDEAREAGRLLLDEGVRPDVVHTSLQTRAVRTANLALEVMGLSWLPARRHWRLNERHYGALQEMDKAATTERYGADQVQLWRRSYDVRPPAMAPDDEKNPGRDDRYRDLPTELIPLTECLKDVVARMLPYWYDHIVPDLRQGFDVLVSAHGNSLRALVKHLKGISDEEIPGLEIPTGVPWVFELAPNLLVTDDRLLGDPEAVRERTESVRQQASPGGEKTAPG